jgi:hypothetical protein
MLFSSRVFAVVQEAAPVNATDAFKLVRRKNVVPTSDCGVRPSVTPSFLVRRTRVASETVMMRDGDGRTARK